MTNLEFRPPTEGQEKGWCALMAGVKATLAPKVGACGSMLRRGLASGTSRSKEEKAAIIMRLRQREEETKKYGAPLGQVAAAPCAPRLRPARTGRHCTSAAAPDTRPAW
jgi:hypothetical protein